MTKLIDELLDEGPFAIFIPVTQGAKQTKEIKKTFDERALIQIAKALELPLLKHLAINGSIKPGASKSFYLQGEIEAKGAQTSIIDFSPINFSIKDSFEVKFFPSERYNDGIDQTSVDSQLKAQDVFIDPEDVLQEPYKEDQLPIGSVFYEQFLMALDPYPGRGENTFVWKSDDNAQSDEGDEHPFAILKNKKFKQ